MESHFRVQLRTEGNAAVLAISGELDLSSSDALGEELAKALDSGAQLVVVDMRELAFMDSTGLGVLVKANQRAQEMDRELAIVRGGNQVQRLLSLTGLEQRLTIVETPEELLGGG